MEGTVTISLKDYEGFREQTAIKEQYLKTAARQIKALERVEELLRVEGLAPDLLEEVTNLLDQWYG